MAEAQEFKQDVLETVSPLLLYSVEDLTNWSNEHFGKDEDCWNWSQRRFDGITLHHNIEAYKSTKPNEEGERSPREAQNLDLTFNILDFIPQNIYEFYNVRILDLSFNNLSEINEAILELKELTVLIVKSNFLTDYSLPKKLCSLEKLSILNLSGNLFRTIPPEIIDMEGSIRSLHMGANQLEDVPRDIWKLINLENLYLGGNNLKEIPAEMGRLHYLRCLNLCQNQLQSLPSSIACLRRLHSLSLYKNQLTTLPPEIVTLKGLVELSLRDNPLVVRFIQDMTYDPPSLQELSARSIKLFRVPFKDRDLPCNLVSYLKSACRCVNPKCKGVYFDVRVEHIKFVDFCGKYRIPLLQYLCSPRCSTSPSISSHSDTTSSDDDADVPASRLKRVLLG